MLIYVQNIGSENGQPARRIAEAARLDNVAVFVASGKASSVARTGITIPCGSIFDGSRGIKRKGWSYMQLISYLNFNGECRKAFEFYQAALGGEMAAMISYEDMGIPDLDEDMKSLVVHARLAIGDQTLMGSDVTDEIHSTPVPVQVSIHVDSAKEAERVFGALAEGGNVIIPLEEQSWAERFGFLEDRFGIPWMVHCEADS